MQAEAAVLVLGDGTETPPVVAAAAGLTSKVLAQHALAHARGRRTPPRPLDPIVWVALPADVAVPGTLYVDLGAGHVITPSVYRRLEDLGAVVAVYLQSARLVATLRDEVRLAAAQRAQAARFVTSLVHDLRGPLGTVKGWAQRLTEEAGEAAHTAGGAILDGVARLDAMIADLVDTQTVRDGRSLPLHIAPCELVGIAEGCAAELRASFGHRFQVAADGPVEGMWSAELLRRAVWNLGANAAQFGRRGTPITIAVSRSADGAALSVHNEGAPKSPDLLARFAGSAVGHGPPVGCGLGLMLVWACAEAHGGRVHASSLHGLGTCFGLRLPFDARPYLVDDERCATRKLRHARAARHS
jgi:signal transduction histidine kinase